MVEGKLHTIVRVLWSAVKCFIILLPALIALFLVLRAIYDENVSDYRYAFALLVIFALTFAVRAPREPSEAKRRRRWGKLLILLLPVLALVPITFVVLVFGKLDMAAFVFHLVFGMGGTPLENFVPYAFTVLVYWSVFLISVLRAQHWLERVPLSTLALAGVLFAVNPLVQDIFGNRFSEKYRDRPSFVADYVEPKLIDDGSRPNLVIVYLEGLERTYGAVEASRAAYQPLADLAAQGLEFTGVDQLHGTAWSLAGTVASRCGVPVLPNGLISARDYGDVKLIAPAVVCLDDVLHARGYDVSYVSTTRIIGNKMGFYGFDNYFSTHGTDQIYDLSNIPHENSEDVQDSLTRDWGLRDTHAFAQGIRLVEAGLARGTPFSVSIATMDTHGPASLMSPECLEPGQSYISDTMVDAVACTAQMTLDFVEQVRALTAGTDTRILLLSDHLAHYNNLHDQLEAFERRNTMILLGGDGAPGVIETQAAMFDVYPTLLDWLGWLDGKKAGIGTSMLSDQQTLVTRYGKDGVDARLRVDLDLSRKIWNVDQP